MINSKNIDKCKYNMKLQEPIIKLFDRSNILIQLIPS